MTKPDEDLENNERIDLATILIKEVGQFGRFQIRTILLCSISVMLVAWTVGEYIFTTGRINTRCFIPECEVDPTAVEFAPAWILYAVPGASLSSFDSCQRYGTLDVATDGNTCPADIFNASEVVDCDTLVYENQFTVVYDFDLGCDEWQRSLIGFIRTFGTFGAMPLTGYISDRWGRRTAMGLSAFNTAWIGLTRYWADTYWGFTISEVVEALLGAGLFSSAYILVLELVGPSYRVIAGAILTTSFSIGQIFLGLIAWAIRYWKPLTLALYIPQFITLFYIWLISESVRWYMSKGQFEKSEALLKKAAKINGKKISDKSLEALKRSVAEAQRNKDMEKGSEPLLIVQVFRNKRILCRCLMSSIWWITVTLIYYGLSINSVNMTGNAYLNYAAVAAAEIPGFWLAVILTDRIGRKPVLIGGYWVCAACQLAYIFLPDDTYGLSLTVYLVGMVSIASVVTAIYIYTAELYPTKYRHNLFAFSSMMGRIGSITAPLTPAMGAATFDNFPFVLFASFAFVSGLMMFFAPETLGTKLPDTMEEANNIGIENKKSTP